jgi:hypothetical protein
MNANIPQWHRIYSLAKEIFRLAPWNWMFESDIFGVHIPNTDRIYFISIMGSGADFPAIAAYRGPRALHQFWQLVELEDMARPEDLLLIPHILLSFTSQSELTKEQNSSIKSSGLKFRGAASWPSLEEIVPGFLPVLPEGDSVSDAEIILEQIIELVRRTANNPDILYSDSEDDDYLVREKTKGRSGTAWSERFILFTDLPEIMYKAEFSRENALKVSFFPENKFIIQLDLVMLPTPIKEKGKKGYFPFALLMADKKDGFIMGMNMLTPVPDLKTMYESVPGEMLTLLENLEKRPLRIEVRSPLMKQLLVPALKTASVRLLQVSRLEMIDEAIASLVSNLEKGPID